MSQIRICDHGDCQEPGLFSVGVWEEGGKSLFDTVDVCGAAHARAEISRWLKMLADTEEAPGA